MLKIEKYIDFIEYHYNLINDLHQRLNSISNPIYLFGAYVFTQYLIAFGLNTAKVVCLIMIKAGKVNGFMEQILWFGLLIFYGV